MSPKKTSPLKYNDVERSSGAPESISPKTPVTKKTRPRGERRIAIGKRTPVASKARDKESILKFIKRTPGAVEDGQPSKTGER